MRKQGSCEVLIGSSDDGQHFLTNDYTSSAGPVSSHLAAFLLSLKGEMQKSSRSSQTLLSSGKMQQHRLPFPLMLVMYCLGTAQFASGFPRPFAGYLSESDIPKNEILALCFSQWTEQSDQPQVSSSIMNLCNSMFNSMQTDEESQMAAAEFTKKDYLDALGRPFFLFRPRNGRTMDGGGV